MRTADSLTLFMCRTAWEPQPLGGLRAIPNLFSYSLVSHLDHSFGFRFCVFLNLFVLISFNTEMYEI
jgi:hypothetical protein